MKSVITSDNDNACISFNIKGIDLDENKHIHFKMNGVNICNGKNNKCEIMIFPNINTSYIVFYVNDESIKIPLSDSQETKDQLIENIRAVHLHNSNLSKTKILGFYGCYLNSHYRGTKCFYPATITHSSDTDGMELTIVKDVNNILKFRLDFQLDVLIKALER